MAKTKKSDPTIRFSALKIEQSILEIRSQNKQFLPSVLPDFWDSVEDRLGVPIHYQNKDATSISRIEKLTELSISQESFSITAHFPNQSLADFFQVSGHFYNAATEYLRIESLARVGFRMVYSLDFDSPTAVAEAFLDLPFISVPGGLSLSAEAKPLIPTYYIGWNDGKKAIVYRLRGNSSKLNVDLPIILARNNEYPERIEKVYNQFVFDVDVFTSAPVMPGEFLPVEWLSQAYEAIKLDGERFFGR